VARSSSSCTKRQAISNAPAASRKRSISWDDKDGRTSLRVHEIEVRVRLHHPQREQPSQRHGVVAYIARLLRAHVEQQPKKAKRS
jgi:hypothetical protein